MENESSAICFLLAFGPTVERVLIAVSSIVNILLFFKSVILSKLWIVAYRTRTRTRTRTKDQD